MNVSQKVEAALKSLLIAGGISEDDCYYNLFQEIDNDRNPDHEAAFPQIAITASPDVPDGEEMTGLSPHRIVNVTVLIATQRMDDKTHATLASYYETVRDAIDAVAGDYAAFASAHLPAGWGACRVVVVDSGEPYFDEELQMIGLSVVVEVHVA